MHNRAVTHDSGQNRDKSKREVIELEGRVIEALPNAVFRVKIDLAPGKDGPAQEILGHISGRLRINHIRILRGDRVRVELTPYDLKRGRITRRL